MIPNVARPLAAHQRHGRAVLFINGQDVGTVDASGGDASWGFGRFNPNSCFSIYAPLFGAWSLLMHAEDEGKSLSRDAAVELAKVEAALDSIRSSLFFVQDQQRVAVAQLIIEGDQLEWKEY
jgi:hypothetical protein